jgi:hypothetical protein
VSLLSRERLLISLTPDELSWVRLSGLFSREVSAKHTVTVEHDYNVRRNDGVIAALLSETTQWEQDNVVVRIVLSNDFVRYLIVPHNDSVSGSEEEQAFARFHFAKVHGEISRGWDIRLSRTFGGTRLACAVDSALIAALQQSFPRDRRPQLASVQPLLMAVFNKGVASVPDTGAWLLVAEADRTSVALLLGKTWRAVQNVKGRFYDLEAWVSLVERVRWSVNFDAVPDTVLVYTTQGSPPPTRTLGSWTVTGLQTRWPLGLLPTRDSAYAMALSAV